MVRSVRGTLLAKNGTAVVIEANGIGYLIATPRSFTALAGTEILLHTHLAVRENAMDLYGFLTEGELAMFELLLTIPKIGPKSALQIMNQADIQVIKKAIVTEDPDFLSKMSEVSKKNAEKIVLALKGKIDDIDLEMLDDTYDNETNDIMETLITLGYAQKDIREVLKLIPSEVTDTGARIRAALKLLAS